jgi:hypothetical protein
VGWPSAFVQNHLVDDPKDVRDGDKRVFYAENQWVYVWATDGSAADPTVWGRYVGQGDRWQAEREPLSHFLLQILVFEAIMGGPYRAFGFGISLAQVEVALGPMRRLPLGSWRWPSEPGWFYASAQLLGFVNPSVTQPGAPTDRFDIMVAGRTADPLSYLAAIEGVEFAMATG